MFGHKLYNSAIRFGHKNNGSTRFGHKLSHSKNTAHMLHDEDRVPKSDLERHTKEHHDYHTSHNHAHR